MKMSRNRSGLQPLKATVPFMLHKAAGTAITNITPGDRTKAEWRLQTQIRRTVSLDAIVGLYLQGQWPKEGDGHDREDKFTQTPHAWLAGAKTTAVGFHKRSASWGNSECLQDGSDVCADSFFKLKQLQQKKRSGVLVGNQEKLHNQHQSPALLIPPASLIRLSSRLRQSEERLDQELEKVFTHNSSVHQCGPRHKDALFSFKSKLNTRRNSGAADTEEHTQHTVMWRDTEETVDKGIVE